MCGVFRFWNNFGSIHVGSPYHIAVACYTWLILVINCNNEVCSCSNNTVSKAFWQKKVLPEQRISCCGVISNHRTKVVRNQKSEWTPKMFSEISYDEYGKYDELCSQIHLNFRSNLNLQGYWNENITLHIIICWSSSMFCHKQMKT